MLTIKSIVTNIYQFFATTFKVINIFDKTAERDLLKLNLIVKYRYIKDSIKSLQLSNNLKKMYLSYIVLASALVLLNISPSATGESRLLTLANANSVIDTNPILFLAPPIATVNLNLVENNSLFFKYKVIVGENVDSLADRFGIAPSSITSSNNTTELKEGVEIVVPTANGVLIPYNFGAGNISKVILFQAVNIEKSNFDQQLGDRQDGYIFIPGEGDKIKQEYEVKVARIKYNIAESQKIELIKASEASKSTQATNKVTPNAKVSNSPQNVNVDSDFGSSLVGFVNQFQGSKAHDGRGNYYGQCVSLVKQWQIYIGASYGIWPGGVPSSAYSSFLNGYTSMAPSNNNYKVIVIGDHSQLKAGDIVIISSFSSHTGIATGNNTGQSYEIFDQNNPVGSAAGFSNNPSSGFIGALRYIKN